MHSIFYHLLTVPVNRDKCHIRLVLHTFSADEGPDAFILKIQFKFGNLEIWTVATVFLFCTFPFDTTAKRPK